MLIYKIIDFIKLYKIKIIITLVILIIISISLYFIINYFMVKNHFKGYSFYNRNISKCIKPLFTMNTHDKNECIEKCNNMKDCKGITYDPNEETCLGTGIDGVLRQEIDSNVEAWLKDDEQITNYESLLFISTNNSLLVSKDEIKEPIIDNQFNYNFYIYINNLNEENIYWRHIFHKGDDIEDIKYEKWSDIELVIPQQFIGVWLSPFNTTLRIAITTRSKLDYIDIPNIPINQILMISVNVFDKVMEVYINSLLVKIKHLSNYPKFNYGNLYVKYDNTFNGLVMNLSYTPSAISHKILKEKYESTYKKVEKLLYN